MKHIRLSLTPCDLLPGPAMIPVGSTASETVGYSCYLDANPTLDALPLVPYSGRRTPGVKMPHASQDDCASILSLA